MKKKLQGKLERERINEKVDRQQFKKITRDVVVNVSFLELLIQSLTM